MPHSEYWLYKAVIKLILFYGFTISLPATYRIKLEKVQQTASTSITGVLLSTPTKSSGILLNPLSTELWGKLHAICNAIRLPVTQPWRNRKEHSQIHNSRTFLEEVDTPLPSSLSTTLSEQESQRGTNRKYHSSRS